MIKFAFIIFCIIFGSVSNAQDLIIGSYLDCKSVKAYRLSSNSEKYELEREQLFMVRIGDDSLEFISNTAAYNAGQVINKYYHQPYFVTGYSDTTGFSVDRQLEKRRFRFHYSSTLSSNIFTMFGYCNKLY